MQECVGYAQCLALFLNLAFMRQDRLADIICHCCLHEPQNNYSTRHRVEDNKLDFFQEKSPQPPRSATFQEDSSAPGSQWLIDLLCRGFKSLTLVKHCPGSSRDPFPEKLRLCLRLCICGIGSLYRCFRVRDSGSGSSCRLLL
ncbi:hypothetical protein LZ31DRAFT_113682 [Colletotrichum somersetense]|nr:hypothetical protein LZ31DRAFT_113682 [Colletotrichum somersetense]